jgi:hypothetical protein
VEGKENESKDFLQFLLNLKDEGDSKTPFTIIHVKSINYTIESNKIL